MITIIDWQENAEFSIEMILSISRDSSALDDTFFPSTSDPSEAHRWLEKFPIRLWSVLLESKPIGSIMTHPPMSPGIPNSFLETGTFITREQRGKGFALTAWRLGEIEIRGSCSGLAGVPWETNQASISRLRKSGFRFSERVWYQSPVPDERSGWCEVWLKELA